MEKLEEELVAFRQAQQEEENEQTGSKRKTDQAMVFLKDEELIRI